MLCLCEKLSRPDFMDDLSAKTQKTGHSVIPAQAGIQCPQIVAERLDPGLHRGDDLLRALHG